MDSDVESNHSGGKIVNKSIFNILVVLIIGVSLVAAFFAGSFISLKSEQVTKSELNNAIASLEAKISKNQVPTQPNIQPIKISADDDPVIGNQDAPITIIEFSDFQCPFCARFQTQTLPLILEQYIETGKVKFVFRDFPIQSSHPNAMPAAAASECADEQNKFWQYHDVLFESQGTWSKMDFTSAITVFKEFATEIELDQEQFNACLDSGKYVNEINNDLTDGRNYEITGTPGFFIGNEKTGFVKVNGAQPFEVFQGIIESQLNS